MNNGHTRNKQAKEFNFDLNSIGDTLRVEQTWLGRK